MRRNIFIIFCISLVFSFSLWAGTKSFSPVNLRGYGKVKGLFKTLSNGSMLEINCQTKEKAQLTHSKYLSDLVLLPGVKEIKTRNISMYYIKSSGYICSFRIGKNVFILSSQTEKGIKNLLSKFPINRAVFTSEIKVPMYLNRWDKYGFMFYYWPWQVPQGKTNDTYNYLKDFSWGKKMDNSGFVFWDQPSQIDTAEGLMNYPYWDWAAKEATKQGLPMEINSAFVNNLTWLDNMYPQQMMQGMPGYVGDVYGPAGWFFSGWISWASGKAFNTLASQEQQSIKKFSKYPNVVSWLDYQGEIGYHGGDLDYLLEYGPYVNKSFQKYLKEKYKYLSVVSKRYTGSSNKIKKWNEIKVPQIVCFFGYNKSAINLKNNWRVHFYNQKKDIPLNWFSKSFNDKTWAKISLGNDTMDFFPKKPAVYRGIFTLSPQYINTHKNIYFYEWDLNDIYQKHIPVYINGKLAGKSRMGFAIHHWGMFNITKLIHPGRNLVAIYVPQGFIAYKVYISPVKEKSYPLMSKEKDALWYDFSNWRHWCRVQQVKKTIESIREIDPNREIEIMAPDEVLDGIKRLAVEYGCNFHNTGYMGAFWANYLPMVSLGAGLPNDVEPGGPASNSTDFKKMLGYYSTEGIQGIDYFIHIGDIMWHKKIRKVFKDNINQIKLIGKYHNRISQTALLFSPQDSRLIGYFWKENFNKVVPYNGYWRWDIDGYLYKDFNFAGITENNMESGYANRFKVIIDTNTTIMDKKAIEAIKRYVKQGGIFITYVQSGRWSPTGSSWPISNLTGYKVVSINPYNKDGQVETGNNLKVLSGQNIFNAKYWDGKQGNGLHLEKISSDCKNLMLWNDGTVAVGMRQIGKGIIIDVGVKFANDRIWWGNPELTEHFFADILDYFHIKKVPFYIRGVNEKPWSGPGIPPPDAHADALVARHFTSNNGLYDVWALYNSTANPVSINMFFRGIKPRICIDVKTGKEIKINKEEGIYYLKDLHFAPYETETFLTPRNINYASKTWFTLQRQWWKGTKKPTYKFPVFEPKFSYNLTDNWKFKPVSENTNIKRYISSEYKDTQWQNINLGIWTPEFKKVKEAVLRKTFIVPKNWKNGKIELWLESFFGPTFIDTGRIFLDGNIIKDWSSDGIKGSLLGNILKSGTIHTIVIEIKGKGVLEGATGNCWLWYTPKAEHQISLSGNWQASDDAYKYDKIIKLPGQWNAYTAKRKFYLPEELKNKNIILYINTNGPILGGIINGHLVRRYHQMYIGNRFNLNITPYVKFGKQNTIEIISENGPSTCNISKICLKIVEKSKGN
jgi:hypothetical protein